MGDPGGIRGLHAYWSFATLRDLSQNPGEIASRLLTGLLGLGLEQAARHLGQERPSFEDFLHWAEATAGPPDALAVARYHAFLDGAAPPPEVQATLDEIEAAPAVLGSEDLAQWDRDGYLVLPAAIGRDEAAAAAALLWDAVGGDPADPASWYGAERQGIMVQLFQHPALEAARTSRRIHKAYAQLLGTADLWPTVDRLSFNPPATPAHPFQGPRLHWDVSLVQPIPMAAQGILYLTDTAADQGALQLVPGFHHEIAGWLASLDGRNPREVDLSYRAVTVPGRAGDLVIWRQDLPHGASENRSTRPRLAQYITYYSAAQEVRDEWL